MHCVFNFRVFISQTCFIWISQLHWILMQMWTRILSVCYRSKVKNVRCWTVLLLNRVTSLCFPCCWSIYRRHDSEWPAVRLRGSCWWLMASWWLSHQTRACSTATTASRETGERQSSRSALLDAATKSFSTYTAWRFANSQRIVVNQVSRSLLTVRCAFLKRRMIVWIHSFS